MDTVLLILSFSDGHVVFIWIRGLCVVLVAILKQRSA